MTLRAEVWTDLVRTTAAVAAAAAAETEARESSFTVVAVYDPRYREPLLFASPLPVTPRALRDLYHDRWPVEQAPLAAKQMIGAVRAFIYAPETCQRVPELALLAGATLSYGAAASPAIPTGFWDRRPQPTPDRLRRALAHVPFPHHFPLPAHIRTKKSRTDHLPKGVWDQRRRAAPEAATPLDLVA